MSYIPFTQSVYLPSSDGEPERRSSRLTTTALTGAALAQAVGRRTIDQTKKVGSYLYSFVPSFTATPVTASKATLVAGAVAAVAAKQVLEQEPTPMERVATTSMLFGRKGNRDTPKAQSIQSVAQPVAIPSQIVYGGATYGGGSYSVREESNPLPLLAISAALLVFVHSRPR